MELAGVFLRMVGPKPWNGPLKPLFERADRTAPVTVVKAAASQALSLGQPHQPWRALRQRNVYRITWQAQVTAWRQAQPYGGEDVRSTLENALHWSRLVSGTTPVSFHAAI